MKCDTHSSCARENNDRDDSGNDSRNEVLAPVGFMAEAVVIIVGVVGVVLVYVVLK